MGVSVVIQESRGLSKDVNVGSYPGSRLKPLERDPGDARSGLSVAPSRVKVWPQLGGTRVKGCCLVAVTMLGAIAVASPWAQAVLAQTAAFVPVTQAMLANPDPADWLHISRTYNQHRFSPLNQINKGNVAQLRMAWSRGLPAGTQESTPIVYRGVMYVMAPGASIQALDATNGDLIWEYRARLSVRRRRRRRRAARTSASTRT